MRQTRWALTIAMAAGKPAAEPFCPADECGAYDDYSADGADRAEIREGILAEEE